MKRIASYIILSFILVVSMSSESRCVTMTDYDGNPATMGAYTSVPPFLTAAVEPNLLLLIDNSASMYDLAYVNDQKYCYDDSYDPSSTYAGYCDPDEYYIYDMTDMQFEQAADQTAAANHLIAATGTKYGASSVANPYVGISIDTTVTPNVVTAFAAKGNFINWAMASKLDIEKEILTGGKLETAGTYGAPNDRLVMESRGCLNKRFVKQVAVSDVGGNTFYLSLGIGAPQEESFPAWENATSYTAGDIVTDLGDLYKATSSGTSSGTGVVDDTGVSWAAYTLTRWTDGASYPANSIVSDNGKMYITATGGTASGTGVADDSGITDWVSYDVTQIEIFPLTTTGFDNSGCQLAVEELGKATPNQGQLKTYIDSCMGYVAGGGQSEEADSNGAFNHAIHNCWYESANSVWPPGAGPSTSIKTDCEHIYTTWGTDPWDITTEDMGYVCFGVYDSDSVTAGLQPLGYVGRCWNPGTGSFQCTKYHPNHPGDPDYCQKWEWVGTISPAWDAAGYADVDTCIETALMEYCGLLEMPEVVDPTDQAGETGEFWNIPAVLIDSGAVAQIGVPLVVFKGYIEQSTAPTGLIQEFADLLRLGTMTFNYDGSDSECTQPDAHILYACADAANRDGGKITSYIDRSAAHTDDVVAALNDIKATSWTPIAEAMYNAIGYYTQKDTRRLHADDFLIDASHPDPVTVWCQSNNILIITDGASTADQANFPEALAPSDGDTDATCTTLSGSTRLDDLTYYAKHGGAAIYTTPQTDGNDKQNITTHIVVAGTPRVTGTDECSPDVLLANAASNAGTPLYTAENPSQLEDQIRAALWMIVGGAASGTAASVVSATRRGEGTIYQAIFYHTYRDVNGTEINWAGQFHGLFVDQYGNIREDTDGDGGLDMGTDNIIVLFFDPVEGCTKARRDTDSDGDGVPDGSPVTIPLSDVNYIWEAGKVLAERDLATNDRHIYTSIDSGWTEFKDTNATALRPYLGQSTDADAANLINYVRGTDQAGYRSRTINLDGTDRVWKMGDIIYSTPTVVGKPVERYDLIYHDRSYNRFKSQHDDRRNVVYVGANDGMLHAFNAGFHDETAHQFTPGAGKILGEELWAYIPYNLLPHLQWLKDPNYSHVYYVDLKPKVTDAKIFAADATHTDGWGTVLVCGMRFGGRAISVTDDFGAGSETRTFRSAYFAFDITDPDNPQLLWEFTDANLGLTTSYPAVVLVDHSTSPETWAIAFGSGPTDYDGTSTQSATTYVVDLKTGAHLGSFATSAGASAFMGDPISVDVDINTSQCTGTGCTYAPDIGYIGNSEGKFYRLLSSGTASVFLDLGSTRPITSEANASQDEEGRLWLYFGTGRFISNADKTNTDIQSLVGVKEPIDWNDCDADTDTTELTIDCATPAVPSLANLLDVTNYTVFEGGYVDIDGDLASDMSFDDLVDDIVQKATDTDVPKHYDGWIINVPAGERCMTEPTVLGGIVTFTTFRPDSHVCAFEGESFVYPLFYKTGTAPYVNIIGYGNNTWTDALGQTHNEILRSLSLGQGVAATPSLHVGEEGGAKAFIQGSTGEIHMIHEMNLMEGYRSRPLYWIQPAD